MTVAKVFMNGRSQAIRLPKEFRVKRSEVYLKKTADGFLVLERDPWEIFHKAIDKLSPDYAETVGERERLKAERRDWTRTFDIE